MVAIVPDLPRDDFMKEGFSIQNREAEFSKPKHLSD